MLVMAHQFIGHEPPLHPQPPALSQEPEYSDEDPMDGAAGTDIIFL